VLPPFYASILRKGSSDKPVTTSWDKTTRFKKHRTELSEESLSWYHWLRSNLLLIYPAILRPSLSIPEEHGSPSPYKEGNSQTTPCRGRGLPENDGADAILAEGFFFFHNNNDNGNGMISPSHSLVDLVQ